MPYLHKNIGVLVRISSKLLIHTKNFISPCLNVLDSNTFLKVIIKILNRIFRQGNKYLFILILKKVLNLAHDQIHFEICVSYIPVTLMMISVQTMVSAVTFHWFKGIYLMVKTLA